MLHESTLNQRAAILFTQELTERTIAAVQRCMDAGLVPDDDAASVTLDLRAAVHGAVSMRLDRPDQPGPPLTDQIERCLVGLVGVAPVGITRMASSVTELTAAASLRSCASLLS
ncbi:hypothetical protein [Nocardia sp. NPDC051463]|uniref:hypothetical protein n=1 Tax=Nocardia sp. NPDC051463 TaxID=3154845 RepID=UPI003421F403